MAWDEGVGIGIATALGAGLLIGIERERRKGHGAGRALAGARTFALAGLLGAATQVLAAPWLTVLAGALIVALTSIGYARERRDDPGITTELALFMTFLLGVDAVDAPRRAAAGAVAVTALLAARQRLHRFSTRVLTTAELHDGLFLGGAALIVLPLLPAQPVAWLPGIAPRRLWALAVLLMVVQAAAHVATRLFGARLGLAAAGLCSGFASSTATVTAMGLRARAHPQATSLCVAAATFSTVATFVQVGLIAATVYPPALAVVWPAMTAGAVTAALAGAMWMRAPRGAVPRAASGSAFSVPGALGFALVLSGATAGVGVLQQHLGAGAVLIGIAVVGLADAHAAAASALSLAASGSLPSSQVTAFILVGLGANTVSKIVAGSTAGGRRYGAGVAAGVSAALAAAWLASWWPLDG